jgi:iron complex transport system permease protein
MTRRTLAGDASPNPFGDAGPNPFGGRGRNGFGITSPNGFGGAPPGPVGDVPVSLSVARRRAALRKRVAATVIGLILVAVASPLSLRFGAASVSWADIVHAVFHYHGTYSDVVVRYFRLPELFVALEVGASLSVAGVLMQGLTRNALADPGILGINAGATFFVVLGISIIGVTSVLSFVWFAFAGALFGVAMGSLVALVGPGRASPLKLTLGGVITASILGTGTQIVTMLNPALSGESGYWATGDVTGKTLGVVAVTLPPIIIGLVIAMPLGRALNGMGMGDDVASSLGQNVARTRLAVIVATVLLAGGAVAAAGPFGFIGFAVPHIIRARVGNDYRWLLPLSAIYGAAVVVIAEIIGRVIDAPGVVPTGEVISIAGAAMFLFSVCRQKGVLPI